MNVQRAMLDRPLTTEDQPELLPAVMTPYYGGLVRGLLGGDEVVVPETMPSYLPVSAVRPAVAELAAGGRVNAGLGDGRLDSAPIGF